MFLFLLRIDWRIWTWNFGHNDQDFEAEIKSRFYSRIWSINLIWILVKIQSLKLDRKSWSWSLQSWILVKTLRLNFDKLALSQAITLVKAVNPLVRCTFGNVFSPSVQVQCANVQGGRVCRRQEGPATLPRCLPHRQWATGGRRGCSMWSPVKKESLSSCIFFSSFLDLFMISFILFITSWLLTVGHSYKNRSPVKKSPYSCCV